MSVACEPADYTQHRCNELFIEITPRSSLGNSKKTATRTNLRSDDHANSELPVTELGPKGLRQTFG